MTYTYEPWRHGRWYVTNVRYPSGAIGCVSRNYPDKKWRIVCHPLPWEDAPTFKSRDEAAAAELTMIQTAKVRLEHLSGEIEAERISYEEIAELQSLTYYIEPGDVQLLEWAGVPEYPEDD